MPGPYNLSNVGAGPTYGAGGQFNNAASGFTSTKYLKSLTSALTSGTAFTCEQWLKTTATGNFVSLTIGNGGDFSMGVNFTGFFSAYLGSALGWKSSGLLISDGLWHHCVVTYDGISTIQFWADGIKRNTVSGAVGFTIPMFVIGNIDQFTSVPWAGSIDETAMFSGTRPSIYTGLTYTIPTSAYTGSESNLVQLYHLESDGTDSAGGASPLSVLPSGIVSSESFGTAVIANGIATVSPTGIVSVESFGSATLSMGPQTAIPSGIVSGESFGTATIANAASSQFFSFDNSGVNTTGIAVNGITGTGRRRIQANGGYSWVNTVVTGTDCWIPSYGATGNDIQITVSNPDGSSPVTTTPTLTTPAFQEGVLLPVFTGLGSDTSKLVTLRITGSGNGATDYFDGDRLFKVNAISTPLVALPTGYGPVYIPSSGLSYLKIEGGNTNQSIKGYVATQTALGGYQVTSTKYRFRVLSGSGDVWIQGYETGAIFHINRLSGDGSSGVPLDSGQSITMGTSSNVTNWYHLGSSLPSGDFIYEITGAIPSGAPITGIMVGGTGINTSGTGLLRTFRYVGVGDSRMAAEDGLTGSSALGRVDLGVMERISQTKNCQIINGGIRATDFAGWNGSNIWDFLSHLPSTPLACIIDLGTNDVKTTGVTTSQLSTLYSTGLGMARTALPGVPLCCEALKPWSSITYAAQHPYNTTIASVVASRVSGGDPLTYFFDMEGAFLADGGGSHVWEPGGSFSNTYYYDGLHLNPTGQAVEATYVMSLLDALSSPITISPTGIVSGQTFGNATLTLSGPQSILAIGISSGQLFGSPTISQVGGLEVILVYAAYMLKGTGTNWSGTPFSLVNSNDATIFYQGVVDTTHAVIVISFVNGDTGPYTLSDGVVNDIILPQMLSVPGLSGMLTINPSSGGRG